MIFGTHDQNTLDQFADVSSRAVRSALMADGHMGYIMPIGGVAAYDNKVSVAGVGYDIACGNCAILTDLTVEDIGHNLRQLADEINDSISFGIGRKNLAANSPDDHELFRDGRWAVLSAVSSADFSARLLDKARAQLGTVGSGNHYVDVFSDEQGRIWVGVHFGSRGFGHTIASGFMSLAQGKPFGERVKEEEALLDLSSMLGGDYWDLMNLAGEYAYAGREWVARFVTNLLGGNEVSMVHNHHNFAWKETHFGQELIVVRKGATPAFPGQRGFVGGSMGDDAVILEGANLGIETDGIYAPYRPEMFDTPESKRQKEALFSTVHGAGRVMSRTEAAGKRDRKTGKLKLDKETGLPVKSGKVTQDMMNEWLRATGVILRGGGLDESPHAYRRLPDVLKAQYDTVTILHTLTPLIVVMAAADCSDPYKD